jgi:hypothetical protein
LSLRQDNWWGSGTVELFTRANNFLSGKKIWIFRVRKFAAFHAGMKIGKRKQISPKAAQPQRGIVVT